jgi:hypothetical protein
LTGGKEPVAEEIAKTACNLSEINEAIENCITIVTIGAADRRETSTWAFKQTSRLTRKRGRTMKLRVVAAVPLLLMGVLVAPAPCGDLFISTGPPNDLMAMATRPSGNGKIEIETGDDFILNERSAITNVSFSGLITGGGTTADISQVVVEIYRVFPLDSTVPPSGNVPTRNNSPSDIAFDSRDSSAGGLTFTTNTLSSSFTALNSVLNGINKVPGQTTGGEGQVAGVEATITTTLSTPFTLDAGHYFLVPQVLLSSANDEFYWLSGLRPIVPPDGTPFAPDLQAWIRNENLAPDWLRVGQDIVGGNPFPTFNASFTIQGQIIPEPSSLVLASIGAFLVVSWSRRRSRHSHP